MFLKHDDYPLFPDLSLSVRDSTDWKIGTLKDFEFPTDITAIAVDPVSRLLAIGTARGVIYLHGGPAVESKLLLPEAVPVQFLQFSLSTERLACLDTGNCLHVWDLSSLGSPKYITMVRWDPVSSMTLSPSHSHMLLALRNGELRTYDLACMRKSPYTLPNLWQLHEEQMLKLGSTPLPGQKFGRQPVELVPHPRNLGLLFIAFQDGVALVDLKERKTIRSFELILPPGAPGGLGYGSQDILLPRRSCVSCVAIHPAGHFFAVGYTDGTIAFWALEDSEEPILVRTLDNLNVNLVDAEMLEAQVNNTTSSDLSPPREPIFKLAWSAFANSKDPRGGNTTLTVLGGTKPDQGFGLNVWWLPAFNPDDPTVSSPPPNQKNIHPFMITAIRQSLQEKSTFQYTTKTPVQDFYLIPRESPHFNCTYDAQSILILSEDGPNGRLLESREFPPPSFGLSAAKSPASETPSSSEDTLHQLNSALESMSLSSHPQSVGLPFEFSGASFAPSGYRILVVAKESYSKIIEDVDSSAKRPRVRLSAGRAHVESSFEVKRSKSQPNRILVCPTKGLVVTFYDISSQLLHAPDDTPLSHDFPEPIDSLEIDLQTALDVIDGELHEFESYSTRSITGTQFVATTLECAITLSTGELLVYHPRPAQSANPAGDQELRLLNYVAVEPWRNSRIEGESITSFSISEIGFIAIAYTDGSLFVIDMRGPTVLHRPTKPIRRSSKSSKHSSFSFHHFVESTAETNAINSLTWAISGIDKDPKPLIRLIAIRNSGNMEDGTFVINTKSGAFCKADRSRFADILHFHSQECEPVVLIASGIKGVKSFLNITGERVGKADWSSKFGEVVGVQIVERLGSRVFVAYTDKNALHVYSLPELEHIHTVPALSSPFRSISIDESGDFISFDLQASSGLIQSATYGTLFNFCRENELPLIDLTSGKVKIPPQPQPVPIGPSSFRSWFQFNQTMSGQQIDELLAGPDRPPPVKRARDIVSQRADATSAASITTSVHP
ncbi:hypothetical protein AN958_06711 [Leucoagaricus sp. SymC.cos]|nr:hypothetical protein AN958_06711 [Leucoagaricus sp. SymC.cos]